MAKKVVITGQREVLRNLQRVALKMKANLYPAMVDVVTFITNESKERTPVRTGNLMGSHRNRVSRNPTGVIGTIYLTASYALYVHEANEETKFRSPWPRGRKFLERAITDNLLEIRVALREWAVK